MNTIRAELEKLGPDAVRRGMVAFEHRGDKNYFGAHGTCPNRATYPCCFLSHSLTGDGYQKHCMAKLLGAVQWHAVEHNFENWKDLPGYSKGREELRLECIAFLAEHGTAIEPAPRNTRRVMQLVGIVCLLLVL